MTTTVDRPYDWGDPNPADSTDTQPLDPTLGYSQLQYSVKSRATPLKFHAGKPFNPDLGIKQLPKPPHRETAAAVVLSEITTANSEPRQYSVVLSDGRIVTATVQMQRPDETYAVGQQVMVTAGDVAGTHFMVGRAYFNELNSLSVTNFEAQQLAADPVNVTFDSISNSTGSANAESGVAGLYGGLSTTISVGTSAAYQISLDVELTPPTRLFEAELDIDISAEVATAGVTGNVAIWGSLPGSITVVASNDLGFTASRGQVVLVAKDDYDGTYRIVAVKNSGILFEASLNAPLLATDTTGSFRGPTVPIWGTPPDTGGSPLAFSNDFSLAGQAGATLLIAQGDDGTYRLLQTKGAKVLFEGTAYGGFTAMSGTALVTPATAIWGTLPSGGNVTARNDFGLSAGSGQAVLVSQGDDGTYYIVQAPPPNTPAQPGGGITFILTGDMTTGTANARVQTAWGNAPNVTGNAVTVLDPEGNFPYAYGPVTATFAAEGVALWTGAGIGYVVVSCNQETMRYRGVLSVPLTTYTGPATVGSLVALNSPPFSQAAAEGSLDAVNVLSLGGQVGDACIVEFNEAEGQWELMMVAPQSQQVMCREQFTADGSNLLQYTTRTVLGWFNDNAESDYGTVSGWTVSDVDCVTTVALDSGDLETVSQSLPFYGVLGEIGEPETIFTTAEVTAYTTLGGTDGTVSVNAALWGQQTTFTAINVDSEGDASAWYSPNTYNYVSSVQISSVGAITYYYTPVFAFGQKGSDLGHSGGSLTTTDYVAVTDVDFTGGNLTYSNATFTVLAVSGVDDGIDLFSTGSVAAVTSLSYTSSTLTAQTTAFSAINPGTQATASWSPWCNFTSYNALNAVTWDGTNLKQTYAPIYVLSTGGNTTTTITTASSCT